MAVSRVLQWSSGNGTDCSVEGAPGDYMAPGCRTGSSGSEDCAAGDTWQ